MFYATNYTTNKNANDLKMKTVLRLQVLNHCFKHVRLISFVNLSTWLQLSFLIINLFLILIIERKNAWGTSKLTSISFSVMTWIFPSKFSLVAVACLKIEHAQWILLRQKWDQHKENINIIYKRTKTGTEDGENNCDRKTAIQSSYPVDDPIILKQAYLNSNKSIVPMVYLFQLSVQDLHLSFKRLFSLRRLC